MVQKIILMQNPSQQLFHTAEQHLFIENYFLTTNELFSFYFTNRKSHVS